MTNNIEKVKGFRDIFVPNSLRREKIARIISQKAKLYGSMPIETSTIEYNDVLKGDNESDEAVSDRFRLKDRGDRDLGLRFEFTFQLSRIFKENSNIKLPWRRYQTGSVFRDEPLRPDRFREFSQFDVDIMGDPTTKADAECLALSNDVLKALGITAEIKVNNRKLLNSIMEKAGVKENQQQVLREIDKLDKLSKQEVEKNLSKMISKDSIKRIFMLMKKDLDYFIDNDFNGSKELEELRDLGKSYGFQIIFTPTLMRGFSYYTGNVFEIWNKDKRCALAGGGRFDDKVGKYLDKQIPAVGISFGTLLDLEGIDISEERTQFIIVSLNQDEKSVSLAQKIRQSGRSCVIFYGKPSKALEYANSYNINNVVFVGEKEIKEKKFTVKNLDTGKEEKLSEKELLE